MSSNAQKLAKGSFLRMASFFLSIIVIFFMMPFIIHSLGDKMYGFWVFVGSFLGFYGILDFGLLSAVQRYVSRAIGTDDHDEVNLIVNSALFVFSLFGLLVLIISGVIAIVVPMFVKNITDVALFRTIILILGTNFAIGFPMRAIAGLLTSQLRFDLRSYIDLTKLFLQTLLVIVFLKTGYGVLALAIITFTVNCVTHIMTFVCAKMISKNVVISRKFINKSKIKALFNYSRFSFIAQIADQLRFNIDYFVITAFLGLSYVTVYSIASRLIRYFGDFMIEAVGFMTPVFSQYEAKGDYESIREKFMFMTKISGYLTFFIGGSMIIFGHAFIRRWVGSEYAEAYPLLIVLVVPTIFALMQAPSIQLMFGISKHKYFAISNSIEGVANLILSLILVKKFGVMGVALGTAIPMMIIKLFVQPVFVCRSIKLSVFKYYFVIVVPILLKSFVVLFFFWIYIRNIIDPNYMKILTLVICTFIYFVVVIFIIGFKSNEKKIFMKVLSKNKKR